MILAGEKMVELAMGKIVEMATPRPENMPTAAAKKHWIY